MFQEQALYNTRGDPAGRSPQRSPRWRAHPAAAAAAGPPPGRIFTEEDGEVDKNRKVILSAEAWHQLFGARENAVGSDLRINGELHTVVGVLRRILFRSRCEAGCWRSRQRTRATTGATATTGLTRAAESDATLEQARQQIDALNIRNLDRFPHLQGDPDQRALPHQGAAAGTPGPRDSSTLFLLWGGAFVLLIGAVNVTNLMLVRSSGRMKELATRHALGAGMGRLARQLLTETLILTMVAGSLGLLLGWTGLRRLSTFGFEQTPRGLRSPSMSGSSHSRWHLSRRSAC